MEIYKLKSSVIINGEVQNEGFLISSDEITEDLKESLISRDLVEEILSVKEN